MKKIFFLLPVLFLTGCEDILKEAPKAVAVETFYNTAGEVETAVNAVYAPLRNSASGLGGEYAAQLEAYTDYSYGRPGSSYAVLSDFQGLNSTNITRVSGMWTQLYLSIRNANLVIQKAPAGTKISKADVDKYVAEAKFLRALAYFHLVRNWGAVPLRTEANLNEPNIKRTAEAQIFDQIIADLKVAEEGLLDKPAQSGRPSKWAAKTVLADVYFYQNKYAEAVSKADEVIKSGKFSLVPVTVANDFEKVFGPTVISSSEEIFYLKFTRLAGQGMYFAMFAHHPGSKLHGAGGFYGHSSDSKGNSVIAAWDEKDLRKSYNWYSWNIGLGDFSLLNKKFSDPLAPGQDAAGNDLPLYRYADVLLLFAEASNRAGNGPTAAGLDALNQVHRRAYGKPVTAVSEVDFKLSDFNTNTFNDLVLKERGYETQYEAKRWLDLKRLGKEKVKQIIKNAVGKDVADKHFLWPIPVGELNYNTALDPKADQNPGY